MAITGNIRRAVASLTLACMITEVIVPTSAALALTGGPKQPDFAGFEPVGTTNMVDALSGQFTYNLPVVNVPGPNGAGYAMSLSYHSGVSPEQEASWVGFGWTLTPGAISRSKRGLPDDYKGDVVRVWNDVDDNWTVTAGIKTTPETFGKQLFPGLGLNGSVALRYNNYKGFGYVAGATADVKGLASLSASVDDGEASFSARINPAGFLSQLDLLSQPNNEVLQASTAHDIGTYAMRSIEQMGGMAFNNTFGNSYRTAHVTPYEGEAINVTGEYEKEIMAMPVGADVGFTGSYTRQGPANNGLTALDGYGYMYSGARPGPDASGGGEAMMDYHLEKQSPYGQRDHFLALPFSDADQFSVSGEGMGGGFRLHNRQPGQFWPNHATSTMNIIEVSGQVHEGFFGIAAVLGAGATFGLGRQQLSVSGWIDGNNNMFADPDARDENVFFRMNNDRGGYVTYDDDDAAVQAGITSGAAFGLADHTPNMGAAGVGTLNGGVRSGRALHVAYSKMADWSSPSANKLEKPENYEVKDKESIAQLNHTLGVLRYRGEKRLPKDILRDRNRLGQFAITNAQGARYVYGLPVISFDERQVQLGLRGRYSGSLTASQIHAPVTMSQASAVVGEEQPGAYASEFLLSGIESPDYIDRTLDGYTPDDFGGYVKFRYRLSEVTSGGLVDADYRWRVPYNGLTFNRGSHSDPKDDMGGVSSGRRTVFHLESIETKTHVAVFVTNKHGQFNRGNYWRERSRLGSWYWGHEATEPLTVSGHERRDGYEAVEDELQASSSSTATSAQDQSGEQSPNHMERLERIELWSKSGQGTLGRQIQTTHFEYSYELCKGVPNAFTPSGSPESTGKLTLKRVFFEYNGTISARVSPYEFTYAYPAASEFSGLASEVSTKYASVLSHGSSLNAAVQNPSYQPYHVGRWGYYRSEGQDRASRMIPWDDQKEPSTSFDPAAWHLKQIRLPSGGRIVVQYEQADYAYVQNRVAMIMTPLVAPSPFAPDKFALDITAAGFATGQTAALVEAMTDLYIRRREKIYYKILHSLTGTAASLASRRSEYLTGYAAVESITVSGGYIVVELKGGLPNAPGMLTMAQNFVKTSRAGLLTEDALPNIGDASERVGMVRGKLGGRHWERDPIDTGSTAIDWANSWLRVPVGIPGKIIRPKLGGGVRTKRVLMYDPGLEPNAGQLFGTEYLYELEDGTTSGVATNEPQNGREENALVRLLDRRQEPNILERLAGARDKEQFEGPLGESLLPGASVTYARVVAKSIHGGRTNPGFVVSEFHTVKDHPFQCIYGPGDISTGSVTRIDPRPQIMAIVTPFFSFVRNNQYATQGYRFIINNMHGQPKRTSTYGGLYDEPDTWVESASQEYRYFEPGDDIPVMDEYGVNPAVRYEALGMEMEVVSEGRSVVDETIEAKLDIDVTAVFSPYLLTPLFFYTAQPNGASYTQSKLKTHVTTKVVRYPTFVRSVHARQDGIEQVTENVGFDPASGEAIATRTFDGYEGLHLQKASGGAGGAHNRSRRSFAFPAAVQYREMGQRAANEGAEIVSGASLTISKHVSDGIHSLVFTHDDPGDRCNANSYLTPGDLVRLYTPVNGRYSAASSHGVFHVSRIIGNRVILEPHSHSTPASAMSTVSVKIISSGRTNQLGVPRATISTYRQ